MDDLLDLNWTSSSTVKVSAPAHASSTAANSTSRAASPAYSAFDSLARANASYVPNYASTHSTQNGVQRSVTPVSIARTPSPNPVANVSKQASASARDAFDSLFDNGGASSKTAAATASMTLQERMRTQSSNLGFSTPLDKQVPPKKAGTSDVWDFDMLSPSVSPQPVDPIIATTGTTKRVSSPFDVFDFPSGTSQSPGTAHKSDWMASKPRSDKASHLGESDDILGILGQPAPIASTSKHSPEIRAPQPTKPSFAKDDSTIATSSRPPSRPTAARTPSPPPHILGQVVAMGFSVQQARLALAATLGAERPGKWSINAAMAVLASDGAAQAARKRETGSSTRPTFQDEEEEEGMLYKSSSRPRDRDSLRRREEPSTNHGRNGTGSESPANDILQQASMFGSTMLKSANTYWKTSKAQLQKAIEENKLNIPVVSGPSSGRSTPNSARPRWMTEDADDGDATMDDGRSQTTGGRTIGKQSFRDESDTGILQDDPLPVHPSERRAVSGSGSTQKGSDFRRPVNSGITVEVASLQTQPSRGPSHEQPKSASFLDAPRLEKQMYASPHRRKAASSAPVTAVPSKSPSTPSTSTKSTRPRRAIVKASTEQLAKSAKYRITGNEHFKLGMYGDAVEAYNLSLDALPEEHLGRIAVLNNRANARLKIGQERKAAEDASAVLTLLASPTDLSTMGREDWEVVLHDFDKHPAGLDGEKFDAHGAMGKALSRRARGYEGCEKWRLAMLDWQLLTELGDAAVLKSAGGMKLVSEGLSRCRKVVDGPSASTTKSAVKSKPPMRKPTIPVASSPVISDVVDKLRQTNEKAEADEVERIAVKDSVDSKITEWKGGKETNLRALIASLDSVLWEELGWKKVGMHELITDSQLKIRYVRAISKVHPDKLGTDLPVERRLIANAVFSTLSDAWNAMQNK